MIRKLSLLAAFAACAFAPSVALALGVSIVNVSSSGGNPAVLGHLDVLTVDLFVENNDNTDVFGHALAVRGYDPDADGIANGLTLAGGAVTPSLFSATFVGGTGALGGIPNVLSAPQQLGTPGTPELPVGAPGYVAPSELHTLVFNGVGVIASNGNGSNDSDPFDPDNTSAGTSGLHFRVQLQASTLGLAAPEALTLQFGNFADLGHTTVGDGGSALVFDNDSLIVTVIPEPGTALLMGLGLAGLASQRR